MMPYSEARNKISRGVLVIAALGAGAVAVGHGVYGAPAPETSQHAATPAPGKGRQHAERTVTEADNGGAVTLHGGDSLIVRLPENPSTGFGWALVNMPEMPLRLVSARRQAARVPRGVVGAPGTREFHFVAAGEASYTRGVYLKLLHLRPFEAGIKNARLWEIKVTIPGS